MIDLSGQPAGLAVFFERYTLGESATAGRTPVGFGLRGQNGVTMAADAFHETSVPDGGC